MENTPKALPGAWTLVVEAWKLFTSTWNASVKTSIYFLYVGLAVFAAALLTKLHGAFAFLEGIVGLVAGVAVVWISIQLYQTMLNLEGGKRPLAPAEASKKAWTIFLPFFLVSILVGLATLGGIILFILPGIYLAIAFSFSQMILVDKGTRGTQALAASRALVRGRWWETFWRLLVGGIVFGLLIGLVVGIPTGILGGIAGPEAMQTGYGRQIDPVVNGTIMLIHYVVQAAFMPLMVGFTVKVYRALQKTR
ncbi:hypothetical protein KJ781_02105 [Patescibacteria group bacterium]|nr:hypothetical protein [Patescibacteria group bacterium]MBU1448943.1 hypothetical protein [Patescibacteria group bacterium]MBU2612895.1 hypothetical protein [Patescibacteria group bacterium]